MIPVWWSWRRCFARRRTPKASSLRWAWKECWSTPPAPNATGTDRLPAFNPAPNDVAGAGDALFVTTSLAMTGGANVWLASYLGALAAGCQVARLGNTPLSTSEIARELDDHEC